MKNHDCKYQPIIKQKIEKLTETLRNTQNDPNLPEDKIKITTIHLKKRIQLLHKETHQRNRDSLAAVNVVEGEHIGKTWSNRNKESKPRDTIKRLKNPNTNETTKNPTEIAEIAARYHKTLQHDGHDPRNQPETNALMNVLKHIKPRVSEENKRKLTNQIMEDKIRTVMNNTTNEKAPGPDGIPVDLWKSLKNQFQATKGKPRNERNCNITWILTQVYRDIEENGITKGSDFHEGCMCLIYKKRTQTT